MVRGSNPVEASSFLARLHVHVIVQFMCALDDLVFFIRLPHACSVRAMNLLCSVTADGLQSKIVSRP